MLFRKSVSVTAMVLTLGFAIVGCTDDDNAPEEVVTPEGSEQPVEPPVDGQGLADFTAPTVYFAFDDYTLSADAESKLNDIAEHLKSNQNAIAQIEGHGDERGSIEYNLALGQRRAESVKSYLTRLGVDANRLSTISYGEEKPAVEGHDESAWSMNRRAEFIITN